MKNRAHKHIVVGSLNPVKVEATLKAFRTIWPATHWSANGTEVASGISDQPLSDEEAMRGAKNRAKRALKQNKADFGVGIEGGMQKIGSHFFESGWAVVVNLKGEMGVASSARMIILPRILRSIKKGVELGTACDAVFHATHSKKSSGYFGLMTQNAITRTEGYKDGVIMALVRFLHPSLF